MADPLVLGIDPDSKSTAWAIASLAKLVAVGVIRGPANGDGTTQVSILRHAGTVLESLAARYDLAMHVVEAQFLHAGGAASSESILKLALVAGGLIGQLVMIDPKKPACFVSPAEWKKQVPKNINQARSFDHYGIQYNMGNDYTVPAGCAVIARVDGYGKLKNSDWKHVGDAVGLALFGARLLASNAAR